MLTLKDIRRRVRNRLDDNEAPYLWNDDELLDYINDTIADAAIRANLVVEDNYSIPLVVGTAQYALPSNFLAVKSVRLASDPYYTLVEYSIRQQEQYVSGRSNSTGTPTRYALDLTKAGGGNDSGIRVRTITFLETPDVADTAYLDVIRMPAMLSNDCEYESPELDEIWHTDLIFGITALAYLKRDADTFDPKKSERDFAIFEERFGPRIWAAVVRERQTDVPREMILG